MGGRVRRHRPRSSVREEEHQRSERPEDHAADRRDAAARRQRERDGAGGAGGTHRDGPPAPEAHRERFVSGAPVRLDVLQVAEEDERQVREEGRRHRRAHVRVEEHCERITSARERTKQRQRRDDPGVPRRPRPEPPLHRRVRRQPGDRKDGEERDDGAEREEHERAHGEAGKRHDEDIAWPDEPLNHRTVGRRDRIGVELRDVGERLTKSIGDEEDASHDERMDRRDRTCERDTDEPGRAGDEAEVRPERHPVGAREPRAEDRRRWRQHLARRAHAALPICR